MSTSATIGLDVGGTKVAGAVVTADHELLARRERSSLVDGERDPGSRVTRRLAEDLLHSAAGVGLTIDGIGAGFPEFVDPGGRLRSREVVAWTTQPGELLSDLAPVTIESDVRCAALGEGTLGIARGLPSYAFVIVGTGLSYALVEQGRVRRGARGEAIALGELEVSRLVDPSTILSLERYASGEAIRQRYMATTGQEVPGAADVVDLAASGHEAAMAVVTSAARAIGVGLATLVSIIDPGAIVVGGGVSASVGPWRSMLESAYQERAGGRPDPPPILWATLGSDAGIVGAAEAHRAAVASSLGDSGS